MGERCMRACSPSETTSSMRDTTTGASLEVAEKGHVRESRKLTWMGKQSDPASRLQFTRIPSDCGNRKMT